MKSVWAEPMDSAEPPIGPALIALDSVDGRASHRRKSGRVSHVSGGSRYNPPRTLGRPNYLVIDPREPGILWVRSWLVEDQMQLPERKRNEYLDLRRPYEPESIRLVIIAESPPASGLYFYDPTGARTEPLFAALMRQLRLSPLMKEDGLREFRRSGWLLVDATYEPVNERTGSWKDRVIDRDYPLLRDDLAKLISDRSIPLVLIKANVCRILEPKLAKDGFNVLNGGRVIPFPSTGHQKEFHQQFGAILESTGMIPGGNASPSVQTSESNTLTAKPPTLFT